jgi:hypothetical protein
MISKVYLIMALCVAGVYSQLVTIKSTQIMFQFNTAVADGDYIAYGDPNLLPTSPVDLRVVLKKGVTYIRGMYKIDNSKKLLQQLQL